MKIRLDDMTIEDVKELYNPMFKDLIEETVLERLYLKYLEKYKEMKVAEKNGYKAPSAMGRKYSYLRNMLYGWYIEDLFYILLQKNPKIESVILSGDDREHKFLYDHENKKIGISGDKTTNPDYLITLKNGEKIYLELKTAVAEVYSIKVGNVKQLQKTMGFTSIYSLIIMVDLLNGFYEIKDIGYFLNIFPFVNNRMEGQLCYNFPIPSKSFSMIKEEDFSSYINKEIFDTEDIKKYRALYLAEKSGNKDLEKDIKNKIKLDEINAGFEYTQKEYNKAVEKILLKSPNVEFKTWKDLLDESMKE